MPDDRAHDEALMLQGDRIGLRPVRRADLDGLYAAHIAIGSRGIHFPLEVLSESAFRREFDENGFWHASHRIAEKCGFTLEGKVRGAFVNDGQDQDVMFYGLLRTDPRPWHDTDDTDPGQRDTRSSRPDQR